MLEQSKRDKNLKTTEAVYRFVFRNITDDNSVRKVMYSIDGKNETGKLTDNRYLEFKTTPGKHIFQFYYNDAYEEVYSDSLEIQPGYFHEYSVYLSNARYPVMTEKPVIYIYPEKEIDVDFKIDIQGNNIYTYPKYKSSWNFKASPDGTLKFDQNQYRYLFWDAEQKAYEPQNDKKQGFVVEGSQAVEFLEKKLSDAGLTTEEQADFITYWGPRLAAHDRSHVQFIFNDECNQFATFDITPKPDNVYRIYMIWKEYHGGERIAEQKMIKAKRKGFTVVEWGGQEIKVHRKILHNLNLTK